jgi:hypothetical protein
MFPSFGNATAHENGLSTHLEIPCSKCPNFTIEKESQGQAVHVGSATASCIVGRVKHLNKPALTTVPDARVRFSKLNSSPQKGSQR